METKEQSNVELFKDSARRMSEYLAGKGVKVKNTTLLEALAAAMGAKNYRTLRALLDKPAQPEDPDAWKPGQPRYLVHAIYDDNNQRYSDYFGGVDALDAAVCCQVDRNADYCSVTVAAVIDRSTGRTVDTGWVGEDEIQPHGKAVRSMVDTAKGLLSQDSKVPEEVAAALVFLDVSLDEATVELLNELDPEGGIPSPTPFSFKAYGLSQALEPVEAVALVSQYVLDCVQVKAWAKLLTAELRDVYHALALTDYFDFQLRELLEAVELVDEALPADSLAGHPMKPVTWLAIANAEQVFVQGTTYTVAGPTPV